MRWLIVEEQLRDARSHHLQYLQTIAAASKARGIELTIAANTNFASDLRAILTALPVLHDLSRLASSDAGGRWQRQSKLLRNIMVNASAVAHLIKANGPFDCVFCLTTWWPQLATLLLAKWWLGRSFPLLGLLFVIYPRLGEHQGAQLRLVRWLIDRLGDQVTIFAETKYAQQTWAELLGRSVHFVVHPAAPPPVMAGGRTQFSVKSNKYSTLVPLPVTPAKPVVFGFYGFARHEQGVDVLVEALEILQRRGQLKAEFRVLWPQGFRLPDGRWMERDQFAHLAPAVCFLDQALQPAEYVQRLVETNWLVLPYRVHSYEGRCSRISVEAAVMGIPVIYTRGTDLEEVLATHGAGLGVMEDDPEALAEAILSAMKDNGAFQRQATERRVPAQVFFSGARFVEQISAAASSASP
jgi:glycosyltransferase involved in cell wall biosynthesis